MAVLTVLIAEIRRRQRKREMHRLLYSDLNTFFLRSCNTPACSGPRTPFVDLYISPLSVQLLPVVGPTTLQAPSLALCCAAAALTQEVSCRSYSRFDELFAACTNPAPQNNGAPCSGVSSECALLFFAVLFN